MDPEDIHTAHLTNDIYYNDPYFDFLQHFNESCRVKEIGEIIRKWVPGRKHKKVESMTCNTHVTWIHFQCFWKWLSPPKKK